MMMLVMLTLANDDDDGNNHDHHDFGDGDDTACLRNQCRPLVNIDP